MLQMVKALYQLYPESRNCHADSRTPATAASRPRRTPPNWPASPASTAWPLLMIFDGEQLGDLLPVLNKRAEGRDIFNPAASLNANLVSSRWDANDFGCEVSTNILPRWGKSADPEVNPAKFLCPPPQRGAMSLEINRAKFLCPPDPSGAQCR